MKQNDKKPWGIVGDLVFLLDDKGDAIPAKIAKITERDYLFDQIIDDIKIPFKKFPKNKVGYVGGKVFRVKSNALAYKQYGNNLKAIVQDKMINNLGSGEKVYTETQVREILFSVFNTIEHTCSDRFDYINNTILKSALEEIKQEPFI